MNPTHIDHQHIMAFLSVAETGSFSAAAQQLHLTQPAVSKRVALLESQVGAPLFERMARQVVLTEFGAQFLPAARQVRQAMDDLAAVTLDSSRPLSGRLAIALSHYVGLHLLPTILEAFSRRYPDVVLDLRFMDSEAAIMAVAQGSVRLAYGTLGHSAPSSIETTPLWQEKLVPLVALRHAAHRMPTLHELAQHLPMIAPAAHTSTRQAIDIWLNAQQINPLAVIEVNQLDSIALLIGTGIGWGVLPETLQNPGLARLPNTELAPPERQLGLIIQKKRPTHRLAKAFMDCVTECRSQKGDTQPE
ncbi:LysR family transcriptional regulator [Halothiobacillus sp.]|uniref:LysR family transcriptional regulator n=1 Tax=Halothiobacillus sp. TaxID=1891311 RepID=UPI00260A8C93|nr:LysR family transcriptional regulator [Halothiobacillus sp.]